MLNLTELYQVAQAGGTLLQHSNYVGALLKYITCVMKSCQEILQIKGFATLITGEGEDDTSRIKELISESDKVFELAKQCLNQSNAIVHSFFNLPPQASSSGLSASASASSSPSTSTLSTSSSVLPPATSKSVLPTSKKPQETQLQRTQPTKSCIQFSPPTAPASASPDPELMLLDGVQVSEANRRAICEMGARSVTAVNEPAVWLQQNLLTLKTKTEAAVQRERAAAQPNPSKVFTLRSQYLRQYYELMNIAKTQQTTRVNQVIAEYYAVNQAQEQLHLQQQQQQQQQHHFLHQPKDESSQANTATEKVKLALSKSTSRQCKSIDGFLQAFEKTHARNTNNEPNVHEIGKSIITFSNTLAQDMCKSFKASNSETDDILELCTDSVVSRCYQAVFPMFVKKNEMDDLKTNSRLKVLHAMVTPEVTGAKKKFWLVRPEDEGKDKDVGTLAAAAYAECVEAFTEIGRTETLYGKFHCLKRAMDGVALSVKNFYGEITEDLVMGADDVLPVLSFALVRSDLKNAHAEVDFMSELISDKLCMGENGYNLATFMTCIGFIDTITPNDLE